MKKNRIKGILIIIFSVYILLAILMPQFGRVKDYYVEREEALRFWADAVKKYELAYGSAPENLYEAFLLVKNKVAIDDIPVLVYRGLRTDEQEELKKDPVIFENTAEYILIREDESWLVYETKVDANGKVLSIDNLGKIKKHEYDGTLFERSD